jgi:hypothetical protein
VQYIRRLLCSPLSFESTLVHNQNNCKSIEGKIYHHPHYALSKMTAQLPLSKTSQFSTLSPNIVFHDVGTVLATTPQFSRLREGLLFISTPLHLGTRTDHDCVREKLKIRTIVSTLLPKTPRYIRGPVLGSYVVQQYITEEILGLKACHLLLRHGKGFMQNAIDELPMWSRL